MKRGRPVGSKDKNPHKRKGAKSDDAQIDKIQSPEETLEETCDMNNKTPEEEPVPENVETEEISINYVVTGKKWNRNDTVVDENFAYNVALDIMMEDEDLEPKSVEECRHVEKIGQNGKKQLKKN